MPTDDSHPRRAKIAQSARVLAGAFLGEYVLVEEDAIIGPSAVVLGPASAEEPHTLVCKGAEIGANATVLPGITIGLRARVMPGTVVGRSVPPLAIVEGNPARITGYVGTPDNREQEGIRLQAAQTGIRQSRVNGVTLHRFRMVPDLRGSLTVGEFAREIPFVPKRYFLVFDVPTAETRGEHAHHRCEQFLVAVRGSVSIVADDGDMREEFILDRPQLGLYLPPMTWAIQYRYTADAILLVFASEYYDPADYVHNYNEFLALAKRRQAQ